MTVQQLIDALQVVPNKDAEVVVRIEEFCHTVTEVVENEPRVELVHEWQGWE